MQTLKNNIVLTSTLFKNFSYITTPMTEQTYPTRVIIANMNLLTPTTFIKKKYVKSLKLGLVMPSSMKYNTTQ
jgi:hypothetical protein